MPGLELPNELISIIIDYFHVEKPTLKICTLVCRDWIAPSRFHLLHSICVHERDIDKFISLCTSPFSTLHHARTFELEGSPDQRYHNNPGLNKLLTWRSPDGQRTIATVLPWLENLSLRYLSFWIFSNGVKWGLARFRSLRKLSLKNVIFVTRDQLSTLLSLLPRLEVLSLADIEVWYEGARDPAINTLIPKLHTIKLKNTPRGILDLLIPCRSLRVFHLCVLSFSERAFTCGEEVGRLLASAGPSLKEFCAHAQKSKLWSDDDHTSIDLRSIDLTKNTCLRRISLHVMYGLYLPFLRQLVDAASLSASFVPTLQSLEVTYAPRLSTNWETFDILLQLPYFSALSELKLYMADDASVVSSMENTGEGSEAHTILNRETEEFAGRLPRCRARGILRPVEWYAHRHTHF
ncbi:hypothetical protein BOTBODRAFT_178843 [Botryobasidium botryosum FD-172 SS1]|uniref:F-box domain-containing protein n=1 Tax=Botryobasidium botryosum (strain FD-172 SS1) TaxID=930990 RepID=A0A067M222_BOTB1|nr:hypothetical protein BOTBODRAFT_178843 [Botryobasidium botryosum FD-172 SS1]